MRKFKGPDEGAGLEFPRNSKEATVSAVEKVENNRGLTAEYLVGHSRNFGFCSN